MSRDHRKLEVFQLADRLVLEVYSLTATFQPAHRYEIGKQVRRSALSIAANIVEGCARRTTREYLHFMNIAAGSAAETLYLLSVSNRLGLLRPEVYREVEPKYNHVLAGLRKLRISLEGCVDGSPRAKPRAESQTPEA